MPCRTSSGAASRLLPNTGYPRANQGNSGRKPDAAGSANDQGNLFARCA